MRSCRDFVVCRKRVVLESVLKQSSFNRVSLRQETGFFCESAVFHASRHGDSDQQSDQHRDRCGCKQPAAGVFDSAKFSGWSRMDR